MATEEGIVTKIQTPGKVLVSTVRSGACAACTARGMCHTVGGGGEAEVVANNSANARVGDRVVISFQTGSLLKAMFLLYLFPILCLLAGAVIGNNFAYTLQMDSSVSSAIIGFLFFGGAVVFVVAKGNKMAKKDEYQPKIVRILKRGEIEDLTQIQIINTD
jgi:sigma-E factor negative regulatory protein RseC